MLLLYMSLVLRVYHWCYVYVTPGLTYTPPKTDQTEGSGGIREEVRKGVTLG